jgi:uncharacterized membrane protein YqjE
MNEDPLHEAFRGVAPGAVLRRLSLSALGYVRARLELAGLEGKEAAARLGGMLVLAAVAVTLSIAGYLLLCLALVFGVARLVGSEGAWIVISAATGGVHLLLAWGLLKVVQGWLRKPMFASTLEEFRKDDAWLRSTTEKPS